MDNNTINLLRGYAARFETADFIQGDPSWFMHQVEGERNQETIAFIASCLSYGARKQFLPKIQLLLDAAKGEPFRWVKEGLFEGDVPAGKGCFYRLYTYGMMNSFLKTLQMLLTEHGSMKEFAAKTAKDGMALEVLQALGEYFKGHGVIGIVPQPVTSLCKRPCMFMRWMVRDSSPVDIGIWGDIIDKRTLFIPMDTHVLQTARRLELINTKSASWKSVVTLTDEMRHVFPDDPAKGDFALYGADLV